MLKRTDIRRDVRPEPKPRGRQPTQVDRDKIAQAIIKKPDSRWSQLAYRGRLQGIKMLEEAGFDVSELKDD
ncbi:MAG TPA: hypothetical protein VFF13_00545 [archaeon]|nr:hypothetical protein [archaeon]